MNEPIVVIQEVLGRSKQGVTKPFICRGDDEAIYYVKGLGAGRRSQICEWVAGQLATAFGLPVAEYALAMVPDELVEAKVLPDIGELGAGLVFASRQVPDAQELTVTTRDLVTSNTATDVLVFDWWLQNEDRYLTEVGGNPNLLWNQGSGSLAVIDHNQAFDPGFDISRFLDAHVFAGDWNRVFSDYVERMKYEERMVAALDGLEDIRASIPDSWWFLDHDVPADVTWNEIATCLNRCHRKDFWDSK